MKRSFFLLLWGCFAMLPMASAQLLVNKVTTPGSNYGKYQFSIGPNPPLSQIVYPNTAYYKVFINTGDGHYFRGTYLMKGDKVQNADISTFYHSYYVPPVTGQTTPTQIQVKPYAEFVEVYDDGNLPGRLASNPVLTTVNTTTVAPVVTNISPAKIILQWARKVVKNHKNTYIATIKPGVAGTYKVEFTYDGNVFDFDSNLNPDLKNPVTPGPATATTANPYPNNSSPANPNPKTLTAIITIPATTAAATAQVNVFFPLITRNGAVTPASGQIALRATLFLRINEIYQPVNQGVTSASGVKVEAAHDPNYKTSSLQVISSTSDGIIYRIDFQNDGKANADQIHISDELDTLLQDKVPVYVGSSHPLKVTQVPTRVAPRTWQWTFSNLGLVGTSNDNYTSDQEASTKGWISFQVQPRQIIPCQVIVNRARIAFKCNPPVYTDFSYVQMKCTDSTTCGEDRQILPSITGVNAGAQTANLLDPTTATNLPPFNAQSYKWYPSTQVASPFQMNTYVPMARPETYVLVAAKDCIHRIFQVSVNTAGINADSSILVQDVPGNCEANLSFFGGQPPYSFVWSPAVPSSSNPQPSNDPLNSSTYLNLAGRPAMKVTVTDAYGCHETFSPVKGGLCKYNIGEPVGPVIPAPGPIIRH